MAFGTQFMNFRGGVAYDQGYNFGYKVWIENSEDGGRTWRPSTCLPPCVCKLGDHGLYGILASNDGGTDTDFNDCVVTISIWNHSTD